MTDPIRVLIVEDHPIAADGLANYLATADDLQVMDICTRGEEVEDAVLQMQPNIILLDLELDGSQISGLEVAQIVRRCAPATKILVVSAYADEHHVFAAMRAGVNGYLLKTNGRVEMIDAIRTVVGGKQIFDDRVMTILNSFFSQVTVETETAVSLTDREWDVLSLIAQNKQNDEIAAALTIALGTVKTHVSNILRKLNLSNRQEAQVWYQLNKPKQ